MSDANEGDKMTIDKNPFEAEDTAEPESALEGSSLVTCDTEDLKSQEAQYSTATVALAVKWMYTGLNVGYALGAIPGFCVGAAGGGLVGGTILAASSDCVIADKTEYCEGSLVPSKPVPFTYMQLFKEAGFQGSTTGAVYAGCATGWVVAVPSAVVGVVFGGVVGIVCDTTSLVRRLVS
eukprot:CAMPEP_0194517750 /NCGR_PEP_ID=MMETSP0253-20130528/51001_1 /TAXON_ID=2966 /ORGANISM="Noctiluca scintillans" /LENGTH=178 /DNA_ID=CAMNT_0039361745 /DNA_START=1 /DNA_END=537 /DNA_ORIENTATION=+